MEPIRSREPGRFTRRKSSASPGSGTGEAFQRRLAPSGSAADIDAPEEAERPDASAAIAGLPGVDAPTERLFDAVHEAGQRLLDDRTWTAAQQYREAIRRFLGKVLTEANAVEVHESRQDILSRKRYYLLTEINKSVDRLLEGLVQTQTRQIDILARLEEIEGMLIDLFH